MNGMRKVVSLVFALLIMTFSAPGLAQKSETKYFWATFPELLQAGVTTIDVTINNATPPPGVSTINSGRIRLFGPAEMTITGVQMVAPTVSSVAWSPASGKDITLSNFPGIKNNKFATFRLTLAGVPSTCTGVSWLVNANTGNAYPGGDEFVQSEQVQSQLSTGVGCDGILDCETTGSGGNFVFGQTGITGKRGDNKDISACVKVPYDLVDNRGSTAVRQVEFKWDYAAQPGASFEYTVPWFAELVNANGMPNPTKLAWLEGTSYTALAPGRACIGDTLPTCVGTLTSAIDSTTTSIGVTGTSACPVPASTTVPFAVTIGSERMKVTAIVGSTWTVVRGDGATTAATHTTTAKVASNPLPLDDDGKQMQMCIKSESWKAVGVDYCSPTSSSLCSLIEVTTTVFDLGDGLMER